MNYSIKDLKTIVLNVSNICNLKCTNCIHNKDKEAKTEFMPPYIGDLIGEKLRGINYTGKISISGMGEPLLNPYLYCICKQLAEFDVTVITNGTIMEQNYDDADEYYFRILKLTDFCNIEISIHEDESYAPNSSMKVYIPYFQSLMDDGIIRKDSIKFRNHDIHDPNCTLIPTNRGGAIKKSRKINEPCYYPYYEFMIDYDGSYLMCAHDWLKRSKIDNIDILHLSIYDYFMDYLFKTKVDMVLNPRCMRPCNVCNCNGRLENEDIYTRFVNTHNNLVK